MRPVFERSGFVAAAVALALIAYNLFSPETAKLEWYEISVLTLLTGMLVFGFSAAGHYRRKRLKHLRDLGEL